MSYSQGIPNWTETSNKFWKHFQAWRPTVLQLVPLTFEQGDGHVDIESGKKKKRKITK